MNLGPFKGSIVNFVAGITGITLDTDWSQNAGGGRNIDIDTAVFMLDRNGKVTERKRLVAYMNIASSCRSVRHLGETNDTSEAIAINLSQIPADVDKLILTVSVYKPIVGEHDFSNVSHVNLLISSIEGDWNFDNEDDNDDAFRKDNSGGRDLGNFHITAEEIAGASVIVLGEIRRNDTGWVFEATGAKHEQDFMEFAKSLGYQPEP